MLTATYIGEQTTPTYTGVCGSVINISTDVFCSLDSSEVRGDLNIVVIVW